jgi:hypothetical protein
MRRGFTIPASAGMLQRPATGADGEPIKRHACASRLVFGAESGRICLCVLGTAPSWSTIGRVAGVVYPWHARSREKRVIEETRH